MQNIKIGLDLDRVIFDTNSYVNFVDSVLEKKGMSMKEIFHGNYGRKDFGVLHNEVAKRIGKEDADSLLFSSMEKFVHPRMRSISDFLMMAGGKVFIITVGDEYQKKKLSSFPHTRAVIVSSDYEKAEKVASMKLDFFLDDKPQVIEELRSRGIDSFQVMWFLDEKKRKEAMRDAIDDPMRIANIIVKLLNNSK